jgi:PKD repeat protein
MKAKWLKIFLLFGLVGVSVSIVTFGQQVNITKAEYYFDTDPGIGNGTALTISVPDTVINVFYDLPISGLVEGWHKVIIRTCDSQGKWSMTSGRSFIVYTDTSSGLKIASAEYYVDTDPGVGKATPLNSFSLGTNVSKIDSVSVAAYSKSFHTVNVRVKFDNGIWGLSQGLMFIPDKELVNTSTITSAEYYYDNDPGVGNGIDLNSFSPGIVQDINDSMNWGTMPKIFRTLNIRFKYDNGQWSLAQGRMFIPDKDVYNSPLLDKVEYYFDNDPGIKSATTLLSDINNRNVDYQHSFDISSLSPGPHTISLRSNDYANAWSTNTGRHFYIMDSDTSAIVAAEYCIDNEPGFGKGTAIVITDTGYNINMGHPINLTGINEGHHFISIRMRDKSNHWGVGATRNFYVYDSPVPAPIDSGEYFFDTDPGIQSANRFALPVISNTVDANINLSFAGISTGIHKLFARVRDTLGHYSLYAVANIEVCDGPPPPELIVDNGAIYSDAYLAIQWYDVSTGLLSGENQPIYAPYRSGDYYSTVKENNCVSNPSDTIIFVYDSLDCYTDFEYIIDSLTVAFTNISPNSTNVNWNFGDGVLSYTMNPVHVYPKAGRYNVCLSSVDSVTKCLKRMCKEVAVGDIGCSADFNIKVSHLTKTVTFTDLSTGTTGWTWDFGDGATDVTQNPVHTYTLNGIYKVCHWVRNKAKGCFDQSCKIIKIGNVDTSAIKAAFAFYVTENTNKVTFSDKSSLNVTSWYWTFGDGNYVTGKDPVYEYTKPGTYKACLKVFDKKSGKTDEHCEMITVGADTCNVVASFSSIVRSTKEVEFYNQSSGNYDLYYWNFGDGTTSVLKNPMHQYADAGFYLVSLAIKNSIKGCTDYYAEFIKVGITDCKAAFDYTVDPVGKAVTFTNTSTGNANRYFWYFGDGNYSIDKNPAPYVYGDQGMYRVSLSISNLLGTCVNEYSEAIQVGLVDCNATFTYFVDSGSNTVSFRNKVLGASTNFMWVFGDGEFSNENNPVHHFNKSGYYTVGLNTFDADNWCMDYFEEKILVGNENLDCNADFIYQSTTGSTSVKFFDASDGDIVGYLWNFGDGVSKPGKNIDHNYQKTGYYNVCHIVVNSKKISSVICKPVIVSPGDEADCRADFIYTVDSVSKTAFFNDVSDGKPDSWEWNLGNQDTPTNSSVSTHYTKSGYYLVGLKIQNSSSGCNDKTYKLINVSEAGTIKAGFGFDPKNFSLKAGGYPVDFTGAGCGDQSRLEWNFGDEGSDTNIDTTTTTPRHVYINPGSYKVCYTVTDQSTGKTDEFCDTVSTKMFCATDTFPPVVSCKNITVGLNAKDSAAITPDMLDNGSFDDCSDVIFSASKTTFNQSNIGSNTIILTVKDASKNISTCEAIVTVQPYDAVKNITVNNGVKVWPNPFNNIVNLSFDLNRSSQIEVVLYDLQGKYVETIIKTYKLSGNYNIVWSSGLLPKGSYLLEIRSAESIIGRRILLKE